MYIYASVIRSSRHSMVLSSPGSLLRNGAVEVSELMKLLVPSRRRWMWAVPEDQLGPAGLTLPPWGADQNGWVMLIADDGWATPSLRNPANDMLIYWSDTWSRACFPSDGFLSSYFFLFSWVIWGRQGLIAIDASRLHQLGWNTAPEPNPQHDRVWRTRHHDYGVVTGSIDALRYIV